MRASMATSEVNHHLSTLATRQLSRERDKAEVKIRAKLHVEAKLHVKVHVESTCAFELTTVLRITLKILILILHVNSDE